MSVAIGRWITHDLVSLIQFVCWKLPLISHDRLNINKEADLNYLLKQFESLLIALTFKFIILDIINALENINQVLSMCQKMLI